MEDKHRDRVGIGEEMWSATGSSRAGARLRKERKMRVDLDNNTSPPVCLDPLDASSRLRPLCQTSVSFGPHKVALPSGIYLLLSTAHDPVLVQMNDPRFDSPIRT